MVTKERLSQLLQEQGWYLAMVPKRGQGKLFAYAKRRVGKCGQSRYLKAESKLAELTEDEVLRRIQTGNKATY